MMDHKLSSAYHVSYFKTLQINKKENRLITEKTKRLKFTRQKQCQPLVSVNQL